MMYKVNNAVMAKELAKEHNLSYGMSLFDGKWYVGSPEELKKIGVTDIDKSENISKAKHIIDMLEEEEWRIKYVRMEPSTDSILKKYAPGEKKFDVQVYDDPEATKKYARFMWDQSGKPKKSQKRAMINGYTWELQWLPDLTEAYAAPFIWIRLGDMDEYESFDSLEDAIEYLKEYNVGEVVDWKKHGMETIQFQGRNYISIFYGTQDAEPIKGASLSSTEKKQIEKALKG